MNNKLSFKPEILAPAGDAERAYIAADAGADAVYFGLEDFSARQAAVNIKPSQLSELVKDLHQQGVKSYVTLNTILYDHELPKARSYLDHCINAEVDGIIVQDLYWLLLFNELQPKLELHASTQMNVHSDLDLEAAAELGYKRVVLPRETSAAQLKNWSSKAQELDLETEFFVHGAVCIAVSGRCQMSFAQGGRSANRGSCAQACRLAYQLQSPQGELLDQGALLSAKDQSLLSNIPLFSNLKINSLKIEGRMKDAAYVRATTSAFRKAVDYWTETEDKTLFAKFAAEQELQLLQVFNRGGSFSNRSFVLGKADQHITGDIVGSYGTLFGLLENTDYRKGTLSFVPDSDLRSNRINNPSLSNTLSKLKPKDLIAIRRKNQQIAVAPIGTVIEENNLVIIKGFHPQKLKKMRAGDQVFLLQNQELNKIIEQNSKSKLQLSLKLKIYADKLIIKAQTRINQKQIVLEKTYLYHEYEMVSQALTEERWSDQFSKTGQTNFELKQIEFSYCDNSKLPPFRISDINQLRREIIKLLEQKVADNFVKERKPFIPNQRISKLTNKIIFEKSLYSNAAIKKEPAEEVKKKTLYNISNPEIFTSLDEIDLKNIDQIELSLLFLSNPNKTANLFDQIFQLKSEIEILIRLPEIMQSAHIELFCELKKRYQNNPQIGFSANGLSILTEKQYSGKLKQINEQANVINSQVLQLLLSSCAAGISISPEWNDQSLNQALNSLSDQDCARIFIPHDYHVSEMFLNYCPLGKNMPNCAKCITDREALWSQTYYLKTIQQPIIEHQLITYPQSCISQIFTNNYDNSIWDQLTKKNRNRVSKRTTAKILINR
ncbi:MAG: peptidase U32 family protein [Saccharofermentanales bacterium]|jgi:collagenase-like PrtC family protease